MDEVFGDKKEWSWGIFAAVFAVLIILHKLRKRRKEKKLLKARAAARAEERKKKKKPAKKGKKKGKKEKSLTEKLLRFVAFQMLKKIITERLIEAEGDLGGGKLAGKLIDTVSPSST